MTNWLNDKSFSHICRYGTTFLASRCDFRDGVEVKDAPKDKAKFASDMAEMSSYHAMNIWPRLNGFQGYDCINWNFK